MARSARRRAQIRRHAARPFPARATGGKSAPPRRLFPVLAEHRVLQHHRAGAGRAHAGRRGARAPHPLLRALECDGDSSARQQAHQRRRTHCELCLRRHALRRRLQPLLARGERELRRRPGLRAGPFRARRLCSRVHVREAHRGADGQLPPGSGRQGPRVVPASVADAGFLAVSDGVDGFGALDGDLPGALHALHEGPRHPRAAGPQGVGVHGRRRDG